MTQLRYIQAAEAMVGANGSASDTLNRGLRDFFTNSGANPDGAPSLIPLANVKAYGAVGDGVADDTAAINLAIASGLPLIYLPTGTYKVTSQIVIGADVELMGAGIDSTIIKAAAAMVSVLKISGNSARVVKLRIDANKAAAPAAATHGVTFAGANFSTFQQVEIRNAILDGVWGGVTGINDSIRFTQCRTQFCGSTFSTGTATVTSGSATVTITGGVIPALYRNASFLRIPSLSQDVLDIDSITPGSPNSTITLGVLATFTGTAAYELRDGSGWNMAAPAGDSNIWSFHDCYANGNALAGMAINVLYGPMVDNFQVDGCLHGVIHGHRGSVQPTAPQGTQLLRLYAEGNLGKGVVIGNASGLTISEPLISGGTGTVVAVDNAGLTSTRLITGAQVYSYDGIRSVFGKKEHGGSITYALGTLIAGGTDSRTVTTGFDCTTARIHVTATGDGAGGADATLVRCAVLSPTGTGFTLFTKNAAAGSQACTVYITVFPG